MDTKKFDLIKELKKYKPYNETEKGYVDEIIEFLENGENQFVRTNLEKHIVASAYLLNDSLDKILLTHHKAIGLWLQFGGHSDGESNSLNVALRETMEESGIENINIGNGEIVDVDIHTIPENKKKNEPEHKHLDIRFIFTTPEENFVVSDESDELKWMPIDEFKKLIKGSAFYKDSDRVVAKIEKYIKSYKS